MAEERVDRIDTIVDLVNRLTGERRATDQLQQDTALALDEAQRKAARRRTRIRREMERRAAFQRAAVEAGIYCAAGAIAYLNAAYERINPYLGVLLGTACAAACILRIGQYIDSRQ